eukprot:jgi/Orpsp1_1/1183610/evm.model.c7180000085943.1
MARNLWSQLDSMAKNNPRGYKELMSKIEEEAKKTLIPVLPTIEPCFSIKLEGTIISGSKIHYINFCKCNAVEENTEENDGGIPIVVREEDGKRKYRKYGRTFHVYDVSFNENIIKRAEADPFFKRNLIFMAINCVEQVFNISFKKDFTITEEKYNGTFIHGHTSREGQPMPNLTQEEVNELLKNASTILNQSSENKDGKDDKNKKKNGSEKPINMTPESILKQHKTYQEEMMENEKDDKINPEIESTMEKLFFSDEKKDINKNSSEKNKSENNNESKNNILIEEMTEVIPESKKSENISEKPNKTFIENKNNNNTTQKNQFIELEGNGLPKIIDLLDEKQRKEDDNNRTISEEESKIFDFLKDFDDHSGNKITELDESNNEISPSKVEELKEESPCKNEELNTETPDKIKLKKDTQNKIKESKKEVKNKIDEMNIKKTNIIEETKESLSRKINGSSKTEEMKEEIKKDILDDNNDHDNKSKIEEIKEEVKKDILDDNSNNDNKPKIEEIKEEILNNNNDNNNIPNIEINDKTDITPKIEEIFHNNLESINQNIKETNENNTISPKIEEPSHIDPIIEEPSHNNNNETINTDEYKNNNDNTPIIEDITTHDTIISNIEEKNNNDNITPKIEEITQESENLIKLSENNDENSISPKIEEPSFLSETLPIVEEPVQNTDKEPENKDLPHHDSTPIIEEIIHKNKPIPTSTKFNDNLSSKIEEISPNEYNESNEEKITKNSEENSNNNDDNKIDSKEEQELINKIDKLSINKIDEEKNEIQFKTIAIPEKEKPQYLLKTSEHYFYIKIKLPKL